MEILAYIVSIAASTVFWCIFILTILRICQTGGLNISTCKINRYTSVLEKISAPEPQTAQMPPGRFDDVKVLLTGIGMRLLILAIAYAMLRYDREAPVTVSALFEAFIRGDSRHYLNIARTGYTWQEDGKNLLLVFFPLYSYLIRYTALFTQNEIAAAFIVSFASYCAGLCFLHRLVKTEFGGKTAWWAVALISLAPPSFFFGVPMTESLMLLTSAATLYFIRTHRWVHAAIAGGLCAFTRMAGIVLAAAAIVEFITHYKLFALACDGKWTQIRHLMSRKGIWIALMFLGSFAYLFINWQISGNPLQFMYYQRTHWNQGSEYFGLTIINQFRNISQYGNPDVARSVFIPNIVSFIAAFTLLAYAAFRKLSETYITYTLGYIFISFGLTWLLSGPRYTLACVPLFMSAAVFAEKKPVIGGVILAASFIGLLWMMNTFILGGHVY